MSDQEYYRYLLQRGRLASIYRRFYLYPRINRYLQGPVLDIGCGIGDFLRYRDNTVGVDPNPCIVEHCRKLKLNVRHFDGRQIPFEDHRFQGAVMDNVLEHIIRPAPLLSEAARVLSPGGRFVIGVPGRRGYDADPDHKVFYSESNLIDCMAAHGFRLTACLHAPFKSRWCDRRLRQYCIYGIFERS